MPHGRGRAWDVIPRRHVNVFFGPFHLKLISRSARFEILVK